VRLVNPQGADYHGGRGRGRRLQRATAAATSAKLNAPREASSIPQGVLHSADGSEWPHPKRSRLSCQASRVRMLRSRARTGRNSTSFLRRPHLRTHHALTGAVRYTFGYDRTTACDGHRRGQQRDGDRGGTVAVSQQRSVAPDGQRPHSRSTTYGYLASVTNPAERPSGSPRTPTASSRP